MFPETVSVSSVCLHSRHFSRRDAGLPQTCKTQARITQPEGGAPAGNQSPKRKGEIVDADVQVTCFPLKVNRSGEHPGYGKNDESGATQPGSTRDGECKHERQQSEYDECSSSRDKKQQ